MRELVSHLLPHAQRSRDISATEAVREACRAVASEEEPMASPAHWIKGLRQDLTYAARAMRRAPGLTLAATLTLTVGVGAATAMFSVFDAVLLRPLPYRHAARTAVIWNSYPTLPQAAIAAPEFADIQDAPGHFDAVAAVRPQPSTLSGGCASPNR